MRIGINPEKTGLAAVEYRLMGNMPTHPEVRSHIFLPRVVVNFLVSLLTNT